MSAQATSMVLMVRPAAFGFNPETAVDNNYQQVDGRPVADIQAQVLREFDGFVELLQRSGIQVIVVEDTPHPPKPDAVFPNNWFSTHGDGHLLLYPMMSAIRRKERRKDLVNLLADRGFKVDDIVDLTFFEEDGQFLESTGSMVLDRQHQIAYACLSERTHGEPLHYFERLMGYKVISFNAIQSHSKDKTPIYHTNVMMHVGSQLAVVCLDSIVGKSVKQQVKESLESAGKKIVPITIPQKFAFAGNMLELVGQQGKRFTVMSQTAYNGLKAGQRQVIEKYTDLIIPEIPTIEKIGGGSVRCMMAEIFLPK
ncbi:amidinotransferase [Echinicola strongylocentroti]|uniref:Amidinotransferase n=1 Tax=Echinicola strongylocentroti TaxID=1795355 RepID=A0A2Z4IG99_9BACT|nr:arginine deiminase-related protein [Echinicola strongylocentroti]AWW30132.1 amidinotransferase [Echinicola strongylocentroti]